MRVDPRHLRIALAIAEHGTFNKAATALGTSQPALSKSISQLERALGVRLFDRGKRGTTVTEAGRIVLEGASNIEHVLLRTQEAVRAHMQGLAGPLTIGATPSMVLGLLPQALADLARGHPRLAVTVIEGLDGALLPALRRGEIELLVGPLERPETGDADIVELPLARENFFVGVPHGHRLSGRSGFGVEELGDEAWILPSAGSSFHRVIEALFLAAGMGLPANAIRSNSLPFQEMLALSTGRLCFVTPAQLIGRVAPFEVIPLLHAPTRVIGIRHLVTLGNAPMLRALIESVRAAASGLDPAD